MNKKSSPFRTSVFFLSLMLSLFIVLTACTPGSATPPNGGNTQQPNEQEGAGEKSVVSIVYTGSQEAFDIFEQRLADNLDPNANIETNATLIAGESYWDKVNAMFAANSPPDVFFISEPFMKYAKQGVLLDLDSYIAATPEFNLEDFYPASLEFYQYEGKQYGLPQDLNVMLTYYNEDLLEDAGLISPYEQYEAGNWTWDTFLDYAQKLTIKDGDRVTQFGTAYPTVGDWYYSVWIFSNGAQHFTDDLTKSLADDPKAIETYRFTTELATKHGVTPSAVSSVDVAGFSFATGKIAMEVGASWNTGGYLDLPFNWNVAPAPMGDPNVDPLMTYIHNSGFAASKATKNPDAAWAVLKALTTAESYLTDARGRGVLPPRKSVIENEENKILTTEGFPSNYPIISEMLEAGRAYQFTSTQPLESQVYTTVGEEMLHGKITPEEGGKKIAEEINKILAEEANQ